MPTKTKIRQPKIKTDFDMTDPERAFVTYWRQMLGERLAPAFDTRFDAVRKHRFDFQWSTAKVAVEIEGGVFSGGRHTRGKGYEDDCVKYNLAANSGWIVFRFTPSMLSRDPFSCIELVHKKIIERLGMD